MKVKKYIAPSMQEAMKKIRSEMGNEAVILNSKAIQSGGFLGLFAKKKIEVIAALDQELDVPVHSKGKEEQPFFQEKLVYPITSNGGLNSKEQIQSPISEENNLHLAEQIKELKDMLQSIATNDKSELYPEPLKAILQKMTKQEINPSLKGQIMAELLAYWYQMNGNLTNNQLQEKEKELFAQKLKNISFGGISHQRKYINVVGPTGVGKTTTLAKLAAECVLQKNKKVAFITTDTFRIAAIDQLKTYAKILDVPIEVCYSLDDFKEAKKKLDGYDFIFIDTAGRNFLESQYVKDLQSIIDFNEEMETFLVLAATAKTADMLAIYERFSIIPIKRLIITKLDETSTRGSLFEVMMKTNKGIAYTTHGQNVPDDIEVTTKDRIIEQILR
ncbi:flagellar biosynthesis protein FlhF [Metabacillus rhizolycopersici]|uniref:Flagellar biosynthesis protein FlhF n=1 Tax=Metabacillus rhizolycopersici TaxID=2875709 RepID=A0ABS7UPN6_9BACI|nr:flagellar biosynthesis protein FlhF [Metabacillus rhizolycopersici]MBZ5749889.1 flagellar biosynthesis protein FlhF [Metabacillus rhizolycopersici]